MKLLASAEYSRPGRKYSLTHTGPDRPRFGQADSSGWSGWPRTLFTVFCTERSRRGRLCQRLLQSVANKRRPIRVFLMLIPKVSYSAANRDTLSGDPDMNAMLRAALAALVLTAVVGSAASAGTPAHTGPYDNTANSLGGRYVGGGGNG